MCGFHNYDDGNFYRQMKRASPALVARTQQIEAAMAGERVPPDAWETFFEPICGAIAWNHFERMFNARKLALAFLAVKPSPRRFGAGALSFRCVANEDEARPETANTAFPERRFSLST
jgi:hypothetical protein